MTRDQKLIINTREKGYSLGDMFGIFFEDINHAADGGLYAELIQNRSFEFDPIDNPDYHSLTGWEKVIRGNGQVDIFVESVKPLNEKNLNYLVIDAKEPADGVGLMNLGYNTGLALDKGENYKFSFYARLDEDMDKSVIVSIESTEGLVYDQGTILVNSQDWTKYETTLTASQTDYCGRLVITTKEKGKLYLDMVSLFPEATFNYRENGLRKDIAQMLADMKPRFMRFPGGCLVHDGSLNADDRDSMYRWKNTIGDIEKRPTKRNNWRYNQTLGLGFYEYFLFSEDIGAKPIPVVPGGYDPHHNRIVPIDELQPWIDDALDLIEFANGDIDTVWGAKRAEMGHPEPFGLEYIAIGNEEVGAPFFERYAYFHKAIRERYPEIKIINSAGPFAAGGEYDRGWESAREHGSDLVDEHYYQSPEWFLANYHRYDDFKESDPKVFLGEYATIGNTYYNALVEAAFMTGLEKNAHAIGLACYAPLLCNADYVNWQPDLIWFNNKQVVGTPNYYVQKLFMNHHGDHLVDIKAEGFDFNKKPENKPITGAISLVGDNADCEFYDIKLTNKLTGEEISFNDVSYKSKDDPAELTKTDWANYILSLKVKRTSDNKKGAHIYFGEEDKDKRIRWEFGGWENQDSLINSFVGGRGSVLTQNRFSIETDREYQLELHVDNREIRTYIDGELFNETEDKLPVIEPLYYTASIENDSGDIIIKVVNVQDKPVVSSLILEGNDTEYEKGKVYEIAGHDLEATNTFENPDLVSPKEKEITINNNNIIYEFPKQSISIFRLHRFQNK